MDPLTAVATITGLVGLAVQAGVGLSRLIASVKDAPEDLQQLRRETTALHAALQHLQQTFDASSNSYIQPQLTTLEQVTLNTQRTLMNLTSDVSKLIKARSFWKKLQLRPVIDSNLVRRYRDALSMEINMLNLMISSLGERRQANTETLLRKVIELLEQMNGQGLPTYTEAESARISGKTEVTTGDRVEHAGERENQAAQVRASEAKEQQLRAEEVQAKVKETQAREEEARTQKAKETSERRLKEAADRQIAVELKIPPAHLSFSDK